MAANAPSSCASIAMRHAHDLAANFVSCPDRQTDRQREGTASRHVAHAAQRWWRPSLICSSAAAAAAAAGKLFCSSPNLQLFSFVRVHWSAACLSVQCLVQSVVRCTFANDVQLQHLSLSLSISFTHRKSLSLSVAPLQQHETNPQHDDKKIEFLQLSN